jgi:hypothetical protein
MKTGVELVLAVDNKAVVRQEDYRRIVGKI